MSNFYLIKHGGPKANGKIDKLSKFLRNLVNLNKTFLLFSPDKMAIQSACIINRELRLKKGRVKKEKSLKTIENYLGSKDHQLMNFLFCFSAEHISDVENILVVSHEGLIRKTLEAFYVMYIPDKSLKNILDLAGDTVGLPRKLFKTTIERCSVHLIDTKNETISKIYP